MNYLMPYLISDDQLGHRIKPNSAGHDSWGFRNETVLQSVKIVAIGDSQTYGESAKANYSWPAQLQKLMNRNVYNLSLGGYGPVEYWYLLRDKALKLKPSLIIAGFYFGNDLIDAYNSVYTNHYWKELRRPEFVAQESVGSKFIRGLSNDNNDNNNKIMGNLRDWLAHHSILYRVLTYSFMGDTFRSLETRLGNYGRDLIIIKDEENKIYSGLKPVYRLKHLRLNDPKKQEGLQICLDLFKQMNELCMENHIKLIVALIPTKISVFSGYMAHTRRDNSHVIDEVIKNESRVNTMVQSYFIGNNISYIDLLGALSNSIKHNQPYFANFDDHPNKNGYKVIAKSIKEYIDEYYPDLF